MQISILDTQNKTTSFQCTSSDTVGLLKKMIADKKDLIEYFILYKDGIPMEDYCILSDFAITGG